jgi:hypothetical protein
VFTLERIRRRDDAALTAVVEPEPAVGGTADFTRRLLEDSGAEVLPLDRIQGFVRRVQQELRM